VDSRVARSRRRRAVRLPPGRDRGATSKVDSE
jgi:hypothetical protein